MKKTNIICILFLSSSLILNCCNRNKEYEIKINFLKENSHVVNSIDILNNNDSDLNFLKEIILKDSVQIVLLGEQHHSDGTTFLAKTKLIKFLHEELGFDVLAFESGLYDCNKSWDLIKIDQDYENGLKSSIFGLWAYAEEFKSLTEYLQKSLTTSNPLQLTGFDNQLTGLSSKKYLRNDYFSSGLPPLYSGLNKEFNNVINLLAFDNLLKDSVSNDSLSKAGDVLDKILGTIDDRLLKETVNKTKLEYWRNIIAGMKIQINYLKNSKIKNLSEPISNERDIQMAKNLIWLSNNYFHGKKIIVWSANFHILRNLSYISSADTSFLSLLNKAVTIGDILKETFGNKVYSIALTSYKTSEAMNSFEKIVFPPSHGPEGSFEYFMDKTRQQYSFVNLRNLEGFSNTMGIKLTTNIMGHQELEGDWEKMIDGVFYLETIYNSHLPN